MTQPTPIPTEQDLQSLQATLQAELDTYNQAVSALTRKRDCLVSNRPAQLASLDQELLALSRRTAQLEQQRQQQMQQLGAGQLTLRQFAEQLDARRARPFFEARQRLIQAVQTVQQLNRHNQELLNLSIQWIRSSVDVLATAITPEGASYDARGAKTRTKGQLADAVTPSTISHSA